MSGTYKGGTQGISDNVVSKLRRKASGYLTDPDNAVQKQWRAAMTTSEDCVPLPASWPGRQASLISL
jgi:hypothetical protein